MPTSALSARGVSSATIRPLGDDPDPVGEHVGLLEVLGREEDRRPLAVEGLDLLPDLLAADRVEAGGRLVEEQHPRLVHERRGEVEPAPHPARVGPDPAIGRLAQPDPLEQGVAACAGPRPWRSRAASPAARSARVRSSTGRARPPGGRPRSRGVPRRPLDDVVPGDPRATRRGAKQRRQHAHRGRLAGAVRARGRRRSRPRPPRGRPPATALISPPKLRSRPVTSIAAKLGNLPTEAARPNLCIRAGTATSRRNRCSLLSDGRTTSHPTLARHHAAARRGARRRDLRRRRGCRPARADGARSRRLLPEDALPGGRADDRDPARRRRPPRGLQGARRTARSSPGRSASAQPNQTQSDFFGDFYASETLGTRPDRADLGGQAQGLGPRVQAQGTERRGRPELVARQLSGVHAHRPASDPQGRVPRADDPDLVAVVRDRAQPDLATSGAPAAPKPTGPATPSRRSRTARPSRRSARPAPTVATTRPRGSSTGASTTRRAEPPRRGGAPPGRS